MKPIKSVFITLCVAFSFCLPKVIAQDYSEGQVFYYEVNLSDTLSVPDNYVRNQWWQITINEIKRSKVKAEVVLVREEQRKDHTYSNSTNHIYDPNKQIHFVVGHSIPITFFSDKKDVDIDFSSVLDRECSYISNSVVRYKKKLQERAQLDAEYVEVLTELVDCIKHNKHAELVELSSNTSVELVSLSVMPLHQTVKVTVPKDYFSKGLEHFFLLLDRHIGHKYMLINKFSQYKYPLTMGADSSLYAEIPVASCVDIELFVYKGEKAISVKGTYNDGADTIIIQVKKPFVKGRSFRETDTWMESPWLLLEDELALQPMIGSAHPSLEELKFIEDYYFSLHPSEVREGYRGMLYNELKGIMVNRYSTRLTVNQKKKNTDLQFSAKLKDRGVILSPDDLYIDIERLYSISNSPFINSCQHFYEQSAHSFLQERRDFVNTQYAVLNSRNEEFNLEAYSLIEAQVKEHQSILTHSYITGAMPYYSPFLHSVGAQSKDDTLGIYSLDSIFMHTFLRVEYSLLSGYLTYNDYASDAYSYTRLFHQLKHDISNESNKYNLLFELLRNTPISDYDMFNSCFEEFKVMYPNSPYVEMLQHHRSGETRVRLSVGDQVPSFTVYDRNGHAVVLPEKGKWTMFSLGFSKNKRDKDYLLHLDSLTEDLSDKKVSRVIMFYDKNNEKRINKFAQSYDTYATIVSDSVQGSRVISNLGGSRHTFLIDPNGMLQYIHRDNGHKYPQQLMIDFLQDRCSDHVEEKNHSKALLVGISVFFTMILAWFVYYLWERKRRKQEQAKRERLELEMAAVRSQLNPHFIFNALGSIQYLVNEQENKKANAFLTSFARLLRRVLNQSDMEKISLSEEVDTIENYLSLESLRYEFKYHIELDERLNIELVEIPTMLIQPFVENAVIHGVAGMYDRGEIIISMSKGEEATLVVNIKDNGKGLEDTSSKRGNGKGLSLTKQRCKMLERMYGEEIIFNITSLSDLLAAEMGTHVSIRIPIEE